MLMIMLRMNREELLINLSFDTEKIMIKKTPAFAGVPFTCLSFIP
jgi:hypothetical protein